LRDLGAESRNCTHKKEGGRSRDKKMRIGGRVIEGGKFAKRLPPTSDLTRQKRESHEGTAKKRKGTMQAVETEN